RNSWFVTQHTTGFGDVGEAMADVADTALAGYLRTEIRAAQYVGHSLGEFRDREGAPAANVENLTRGVRCFERKSTGTCHIPDVHEVAPRLSVLEDERRIVVEKARTKDCQDAGVWLSQCLPGTLDDEEPERDGVDAVGTSDHQTHPLLVVFRKRVHRGQVRALAFRRRQRNERISISIGEVPFSALHVSDGPLDVVMRTTICAVHPFAVH